MHGCRFAPRCPIAEADCHTIDPPDHATGIVTHRACLHAERTGHTRSTASDRPRCPSAAGEPLLRLADVGQALPFVLDDQAGTGRCVMQTSKIGAARIRRSGRRERQRQEHAGAPDHGTGTCDHRPDRVGRSRRHPRLGRRCATPTALGADGVSGPAIGAQSATKGRRHRHPGVAGGSPHDRPRTAHGTCTRIAGRGGPRRGHCWNAIPRSSPAASVSA